MKGAMRAMSQAASSPAALTAIRASGDIACCSSSFSAPLCRSPETSRIATNGSRNAAASSQALNVGAQPPTSGETASPPPAAVPPSPLASPYVRTALMYDTPTSGPIVTSRLHHAREDTSSRHSLLTSHRRADVREGKEHLFEVV